MESPDEAIRSRLRAHDQRPRYWWRRLPGMDFVPAIYSDLTEAEWAIVKAWYEETDRSRLIGRRLETDRSCAGKD
jgi:hypothetical protein